MKKLKKLLTLLTLFIATIGHAQMVLEYDIETVGNIIKLPLKPGEVNVTVDWGDDSSPEPFTTSGNKPHTYTSTGIKTVTITGTLHGFGRYNIGDGNAQLKRLISWDDNLGLTDLGNAFRNASLLTDVPNHLPSGVTSMHEMFYDAISFKGSNVSSWDVTQVRSDGSGMRDMFVGSSLCTDNYDELLTSWSSQDVNPGVIFSAGDSKYSTIGASAKTTLESKGWTITDAGQGLFPCTDGEMVLEYDIETVGTVIKLPLKPGFVNVTVDWGDDSNPEPFTTSGNKPHTYTSTGIKMVTITGALHGFGRNTIDDGNARLKRLISWDDNLGLTDLNNAFLNASILTEVPSNLPSGVMSLYRAFYNAISFKGSNVGSWNVTQVNSDVLGMTDMFVGSSLCTDNYDELLTNWSSQDVNPGVVFSAGDSKYSTIGASAKMTLESKGWTITDRGEDLNGDGACLEEVGKMVLEYEISAANTEIALPLGGNVDVTVDWGDENTQPFTASGNKSHNFEKPGIYTVTITGTVTTYGISSNSIGNARLTRVVSWNDALGITNFNYAFKGASMLREVPNDFPRTVTNMSNMFYNAKEFNQDIGGWDVSKVSTMSAMFYGATAFNNGGTEGGLPNPLDWDVGNVTDLGAMFYRAGNFNQPLTRNGLSWDVSKATRIINMFNGCTNFNQYIGDWDVSNVTTMVSTFYLAKSFNNGAKDDEVKPLNWDVSSVNNMGSMFRDAEGFNQPLEYNGLAWDVSQVTNMAYMFYNAKGFNEDISDWHVGEVITMNHMFLNAKEFNQDIGGWDVSKVSTMLAMFHGAIAFNNGGTEGGLAHPLDWDVGNVTDLGAMFYRASNFNQPLTRNGLSWDVSKVTRIINMFNGCTNFNQYIGDWDVSNITTMGSTFYLAKSFNNGATDDEIKPLNWDVSSVTAMGSMFRDAENFNQPLEYNGLAWDVSQVTNMAYMFYNVKGFNQDISDWHVGEVITMNNMFLNAKEFNQDIGGWDVSKVSTLSAMFYGATAFNNGGTEGGLAHPLDWDVSNVTDLGAMFYRAGNFNQPLTRNGLSWDVSKATRTINMFNGCTNFNQYIGDWDVSNVTTMGSTFYLAKSFNNGAKDDEIKPLNWDVSSVTAMGSMFRDAEGFNQPLEYNGLAWDVSQVTNMAYMFYNVKGFNQDISDWDVRNVTDMKGMFYLGTLCTDYYDAILNSWSSQDVRSKLTFNAGNSKYSEASTTARETLEGKGWDIVDGGKDLDGSGACRVLEYDCSAPMISYTTSDFNTSDFTVVNQLPLSYGTISIDETNGVVMTDLKGKREKRVYADLPQRLSDDLFSAECDVHVTSGNESAIIAMSFMAGREHGWKAAEDCPEIGGNCARYRNTDQPGISIIVSGYGFGDVTVGGLGVSARTKVSGQTYRVNSDNIQVSPNDINDFKIRFERLNKLEGRLIVYKSDGTEIGQSAVVIPGGIENLFVLEVGQIADISSSRTFTGSVNNITVYDNCELSTKVTDYVDYGTFLFVEKGTINKGAFETTDFKLNVLIDNALSDEAPEYRLYDYKHKAVTNFSFEPLSQGKYRLDVSTLTSSSNEYENIYTLELTDERNIVTKYRFKL